MQKIFITGRINGKSYAQLQEFELAKERLKEIGFTDVTTVFDALPEAEAISVKEKREFYLKERSMIYISADVILYLQGWEEDEVSKNEVETAKSNHRQVYDILNFIQKHSTAKL